MSDKRYKIIYTEGETFNKDTEFCFDCENKDQLENIIQLALISPNQINYVFDEESNQLIACNDPDLYLNIEKQFSGRPPLVFYTKDDHSFKITITPDKFLVYAPSNYGDLSDKDKHEYIDELIGFLKRRFPTLVSTLPYFIQYWNTDKFTVFDFKESESYIFIYDNYLLQYNVTADPDHEDTLICDNCVNRYEPQKKLHITNAYATDIAKYTYEEIQRQRLLSKPVRFIQVHNTVDHDVLYTFRCIPSNSPTIQIASVEIKLNLQIGNNRIGSTIIVCYDDPDIYIRVPKVCKSLERFSEKNIIDIVKHKYFEKVIFHYCSTMLRSLLTEDYRKYRVEYCEELTDVNFTFDKADPITDPNLDNRPMSMQIIIDDHVLHLSLKTDDNFTSIHVVSQDDAWYFDKSELYIYYVMNKIAQEFNKKFPNKGFTVFSNTDCRGIRSYEYVIHYREMDYNSSFDDFYVHIVVPEGDIYCGPNTDICGDDHFRFDLSEPNQNMSHETYLKLKEQYFRIYSKDFKDFYMKYSAE